MTLDTVLSLGILAVVLVGAVSHYRGLNEAVWAVPGALLVVALGLVGLEDAWATVGRLAPTVAFLAAILVFGRLCADEDVFVFLGSLAARSSRGNPRRLLKIVVVLAALVTSVLTLDATVVLLTPVVIATTHRLDLRSRPHAYACAHLANSGSLLLPVSNLTNLLAFTSSGLSFGKFTALMALPWLVVCGANWGALRAFFRRDLRGDAHPVTERSHAPVYPLTVLGLTVAGFVATSAVDLSPAWAALAGCLALGVPALLQRRTTPLRIAGSANVGFLAFVFALGVVVDAVSTHGLESLLRTLLPGGTTLLALLAIAGVAAVLANVVNNIPATLALLPIVAGSPTGVLAVLVGVNVGPNLTYVGSLATLLWRRLLPTADKPRTGQFHLLGALSTPPLVALAVVALWASAAVIG